MRIKFFVGIAAVAALFSMAGCTLAGDNFDHNKAVIVMTGTEINPVLQFVVNDGEINVDEDRYPTYMISATATRKVVKHTEVTFAIDNSLLETYNAQNKTNYFPIPETALEMVGSKGVFEAGQATSTSVSVRVKSADVFEEGRIYMIPVTITSITGGDMPLLEASKTAYLRISRPYTFNSLNLTSNSNAVYTNANTAPYAEYYFPEEKWIDLSAGYTFEIKCYIDSWHPSTSPGYQISRLCNFNTGTGNMLRFGEDGMSIDQLQWISPGGNIVSAGTFEREQWILISLVYDGFAFTLYNNGVKDTELSGSGSDIVFKGIEIGMSWVGTYRQRQRFLGKIAEMRVWDRGLSANQIRQGLCYVDPAAEGLQAYWKFNEGEGHIFNDATGNGYDLDWSQAERADHQSNEGVSNTPVDLSHVVRWYNDYNVNTCNP